MHNLLEILTFLKGRKGVACGEWHLGWERGGRGLLLLLQTLWFHLTFKTMYTYNFDKNKEIQKLQKQSQEREQSLW